MSARCPACGNIAYLSGGTGSLNQDVLAPFAADQALESALRQPDALSVEEILGVWPSEYELWAFLVANFNSADAHMAYMSFCVRTAAFDHATARYSRHLRVMSQTPATFWQAEVAESMLARLPALGLVQLERALASESFDFRLGFFGWPSFGASVRVVTALVFILGACQAAWLLA